MLTHRPIHGFMVVVLAALLVGGGAWAARATAQSGTPVEGSSYATLTLVEHADFVTEIDLGEPGPSAGDMIVWGPDPIFDAADAADTGATSQGSCIAFTAAADCILAETILFADGSTLEFQGIQPGGGVAGPRTIVGGSGRYLGAIGTMAVTPSADLTRWTKTIEIAPPAGRP